MNYLFLGEAGPKKEEQIFALRDKALPEEGSRNFDYDLLHADKLTPQIFKSRLIALPAIASRRFLLLRNVEALSPQNRELLLQFLAGAPDYLDLVLDSNSLKPQDPFVLKLKQYFKLVDMGRPTAPGVFDLTAALDRRQPAEAVQILANLIEEGQHPLQIMGGLVWFWRQKRGRLPRDKFMGGLKALQEADINIKRSRLLPEYAVEMLVVKLGTLLA